MKYGLGDLKFFNIVIDQFNLIKDTKELNIQEKNHEILFVTSIKDYIDVREKIEKIKRLETKKRVIIILKTKDFIDSFADIRSTGKIITITPRMEFERLINEKIPRFIEDSDIIELGLLENRSGLEKIISKLKNEDFPNKELYVEDLILAAVLNSEKLCIPYHNKPDQEILEDIYSLFTTIKLQFLYNKLKNNFFKSLILKRIDKIKNNIKIRCGKEFLDNLELSLKNHTIEKYMDQILSRFLLRKYPDFMTRKLIEDLEHIFGPLIKLKHNEELFFVLENELIKAYMKNKTTDEINKYLYTAFDDLDQPKILEDLILEKTTDFKVFINYLNSCSGFFDIELKFFVYKFTDYVINTYLKGTFEFKKAYEVFNNMKSIFIHLIKKYEKEKPEFINYVDIVEELLKFINEIEFLTKNAASNLDEWKSIYEKHILETDKLKDSLDLKINLLPNKNLLEKLLEEYEKLNSDIISSYEQYIFNNFPNFLHDQAIRPKMILDVVEIIRQLMSNHKIVFLVVDSLTLEIWDVLREVFEENGYTVEKQELILSMIPSATPISRSCLFGGDTLLNLQLASMKSQIPNPYDEHGTLARGLGLKKTDIVYEDQLVKFRDSLKKKAKVHALVYKSPDKFFHATEGERFDTLRKMFMPVFNDLIQNLSLIKEMENVRIVLATDHGLIKIDKEFKPEALDFRNKKTSYIDEFGHKKTKKTYIVDIHGRYMFLSENKDVNRYLRYPRSAFEKEIYESCNKECYVLLRDKLKEYGLPTNMKGIREVIALVMPKKRGYLPTKPVNILNHGGLSFYETIIPLAIIKPIESPKISMPTLNLTESEYRLNEEATLSFTIGNSNEFSFRDTFINIDGLNIYKEKVGIIEARSKKRLDINFIPSKEGIIPIRIEINFSAMGKKEKHIVSRKIEIKPEIRRKDIITREITSILEDMRREDEL